MNASLGGDLTMGNLRRSNLSGVVTVLNTPFALDGTLDLAGLTRHVQYAIAAGVNGFLVPAMASEVGYLTRNERRAMVSTVIESCAGRVPVIGGATAPRQERLGIIDELLSLGCDGILSAIPFTNEPTYRDEVEELAQSGADYLMVQDWDASGYGVPVDLIARLSRDIPSFRCLKVEVVPAGVKYTQVKQATAGQLQVAGGWAVMHLIDGLDRGVDVFMPTGLHELYVGMVKLYREGQREESVRWFRRLLPILTFSNQHLDVSICFFKRLLFRQGIYQTDSVRVSQRFWDETNQRQAEDLIDEALVLIDEMRAMGYCTKNGK